MKNKKKKQIKLKSTKTELQEILHEDSSYKPELFEQQEEVFEESHPKNDDHYHGVHHFDKYGHHDDISKQEFTLKSQFPKSKKSLTFRIAMAALILGLAIAVSAIDAVLEHFSININGVVFEMRLFDLLVIIVGIPVVGLFGSIGIAIVEPWFHFLIDGDHSPFQIALDSVGYSIAVLAFFFIFFVLFKNSPIHKEPNKKKRWFKNITPGFVIVPLLSIVFTAIFVLSLYLMYKTGFEGHTDADTADHVHDAVSHAAEHHEPLDSDEAWHAFINDFAPLFWANFGIQVARFTVMYAFFVVVENAMKPINHRYR